MNNKGFTMIELIATILLIVVSSTVVVINLQGNSSKNNQTQEEKTIAKIEEVTCDAIDSVNAKDLLGYTRDECINASGCSVSLDKLIKSGLVDAYETYDDIGTKINDKRSSITVTIKWISKNGYKVKACTVNK